MNNRRPFRTLVAFALCTAACVPMAAAQDAQKPAPTEVTIYPILVVAPIFGAIDRSPVDCPAGHPVKTAAKQAPRRARPISR